MPSGETPGSERRHSSTAAKWIVLAVIAIPVLFLAGIGAGSLIRPPDTVREVAATPSTAVAPVVQTAGTGPAEPASAVAQTLGPAVVTLANDQGLGSGVLYDSSGLILTNAHVTEGSATSSTLNVQFSDGRTLQGTVVGADPEADIAVVRVDPVQVTVAQLSTSKVLVGETAIAIGSPFGLPQTVTEGIVSAVDRPVDGQSGVTVNMIQTDAPINPGNSGGALADRSGQVIGINTEIFSQSGENNGIGFAIPIQPPKPWPTRS